MHPTQPGINLVVVNYKTDDDLDDFCQSLFENQPTIPWTLTICDVAPEDDQDVAVHWVEQFRALGHEVVLFTFPTNVGYARACNRAALYGNFDHLGFFNADVRLTAGAIDDLVAALGQSPTYAVAGPRQVNDQGKLTAAGIFGPREQPKHRGWMELDNGQYAEFRTDCPTVSGAAFVVVRHVWEELATHPGYLRACEIAELTVPEGAFLPTQHFYEETFCCYFAIDRGYKCCYVGGTTIVHKWHQASPQGSLSSVTKQSQAQFRQVCDILSIPHD